MPLRNYLPKSVSTALFGDRDRWGTVADQNDPMWKDWLSRLEDIYRATQRSGIGKLVNNAGYPILRQVDLAEKVVLEIGPGDLPHTPHWNGKPARYIAVDQSVEFLQVTAQKLGDIDCQTILVDESAFSLPLEDHSVDVVLTFYNLEHLTPLDTYLAELRRVLRPDGVLVGCVPAEGGLAWGLGRRLTTYRWFAANTKIDLMKVICWGHPNFADDIVSQLDRYFQRSLIEYWPMHLPSIDVNLVLSFVYLPRASR